MGVIQWVRKGVPGGGSRMLECLRWISGPQGQKWECRSKNRLLGKDPEFSFVRIKVEVS